MVEVNFSVVVIDVVLAVAVLVDVVVEQVADDSHCTQETIAGCMLRLKPGCILPT
jgi:hypothetical protein